MVSVDPSKEGAGEADNAEAGRQLNREEIVEVLLEAARQVWHHNWDTPPTLQKLELLSILPFPPT